MYPKQLIVYYLLIISPFKYLTDRVEIVIEKDKKSL